MDQEKFQRMLEKQKATKQRSYDKHVAKLKDSESWRRRDYLNELRFSTQNHINCFRGSPSEDGKGESDEHLDMKYQVWKTLRKWKHDVIIEPIFKETGKRGDVLDLKMGVLFEITFSESQQELTEKIKSYPEIFEVRRVDAKQKFDEKLLL